MITYILLTIIVSGCVESTDNYAESTDIQGHENYPSGWEAENLKGKIKTLKQKKAYVIDFKSGKTDEPILEFVKQYNRHGNTVKETYYGAFGEPEQTFEGQYSGDGTNSKTIWKTLVMSTKTVTTEIYDTITGWIVSSEYVMNDSAMDGFTYLYDENGNFKELRPLSGDSGKHLFFEYDYDENGKILSEIQLTNNSGKADTLSAYSCQYDPSGNKIEQFNKSTVDFIKDSRVVFEYDPKNRLVKITEFEEDNLKGIIEYDSLGNEKVQTEYQEGNLASRTRMIYVYDNQGNWIKQSVFRAERDAEEIELFVKTREIEYFK